MQTIIGWDIGGAHLKAARIENGVVTQIATIGCPLWQGVDQLTGAFFAARAIVGEAQAHAVTMTGELCDAFASRHEGVIALARHARSEFPEAHVAVYGGKAGFVAVEAAGAHVASIASANWHATASLVATCRPDALLADMGSTTTDLIPAIHGKVAARGYGDASRAENGELVYTGLVRSFLMALTSRVPFAGRWTGIMAEYFASSADIYRILGELPDGADVMSTADGREKTVEASCARLARMIGRDVSEAPLAEWHKLAAWFQEAQIRNIDDAARQVLSRDDMPMTAPMICAGIGRGQMHRLAARLGRESLDFDSLVAVREGMGPLAADCAPAVAVALLLAKTNP